MTKCYACNKPIRVWQRWINLGYTLVKYKYSTKFIAIGPVHLKCLYKEAELQIHIAEVSRKHYAETCYTAPNTLPNNFNEVKKM